MHGLDRIDEVAFRRVLEQITLGSGLERTQHIAFVRVHAQDHDRGVRQSGIDAQRSFNSAQFGHGDIEDGDIRLRSFRLFHGLAAIRRFGNHAEFGTALQQKPQAAPHHGVIVSQQDANLLHESSRATGVAAMQGNSIDKVVPLPRCERTCMFLPGA